MKNIINYIFIGGFFVLLWSPYMKLNYDPINQISNTENRKLSSLPKFNLKNLIDYVNEYEKYFNDNFGFRADLISWNNYISVLLINESPVPNVVLGIKGWLFFSEGLGNNIKKPAYTEYNLRSIKSTLEEQIKYLNDKGIILITVIAPNKHSIYPEMLPFFLKNSVGNQRLNHRLSYLKQFNDIQEVDLVKPLLSKKFEYNLYYKTDTHWNNYGSFVAYEEIMKVIKIHFPKIELLNNEDFEITTNPYNEGDLLKILAMPFKFTDDKEIIFTLKDESRIKKLSEEKLIPKVLISHDSFFDPQYKWGTVNFLANHFGKVIGTSNGLHFDHDLIEKEMPDIVILEIVERDL